MSWKIILGKPEAPYIIGRRWVKKNIPKSNRISKAHHSDKKYGDIYDIGKHYLPEDPSKKVNLWICMETGSLLTKAPKIVGLPKSQPKPESKVIKPKKVTPKPAKKVSKPIEPKVETPKPEPVIEEAPQPKVAKTPTIKTTTSVAEVKGIGKAAYEKLASAGINTIGDLISKHSQEIATLIGRKSDTQIKTWQQNAKEMLM